MTNLGTASGSGTTVTLTIAQEIPAGQLLVVTVAGGSSTGGTGVSDATVNDTLSGQYLTAVIDVGNDTSYAAIYYRYLATAMPAGTVVTVVFDRATARNAVWALAASNVAVLDQQDGNSGTGLPTATTGGAVTNATGLVVGASITGNGLDAPTYTLPGGYTAGPTWSILHSSGIFGYKTSTTLSGTQTYAPGSNEPTISYVTVVASFKPGTPAMPTALALTHTDNARDFTASWTAGVGNGGVGGCNLEYLKGSTWTRITSANCDVNTSGQQFNLPSTTGWVSNWTPPVSVRLARRYDGIAQGTFPQTLDCVAKAASATPTSSIDEDCDGAWDNTSCTAYAWTVVSNTCPATTCSPCVTSSAVTAAPWSVCDAGATGDTRYTDGLQTTTDPSAVASYGSTSNSCTTPASTPKQGAIRWTCTGSGCTYN